MEFERFGDHYVLRLDPDEEVMATLLDFVGREDIRGGYFLAFGAFCRVRLRYYDVYDKQYSDHDLNQQVEVVSLLGNIARENGKPIIHMHAAVADGLSHTYSGHIGEAVVRPTLEVFLTKFDGEIHREPDPATGLTRLALQ
jgi:uncharacterized protein